MQTDLLTAFIAVAEQRSFSLAAEQLYLTQPAISKRIATLEAELGAPLFDRIGRHIGLTEAGRQLLPRARRLLTEVADLRRSIANLSGEVSGRLLIGTSHHIGLRRLPPVLKRFSRKFPEVELDIRFMDSESACAAVEQGELELAIVTLPPDPPRNLHCQTLWHDPLHFVAAPDHPLARRARIEPDDLARHPAVLAARGTYTRGIIERALAPFGVRLQIGMATNYLETLKMLAAIGLGWSLLPATMTGDGDLRRLEVEELQLARSLGVVRHRARTLSNAARSMVAACQQ